jgi:SAM-dependent methyltransferase
MDWERYWATQPKTVGETEFHLQVGNTICGRPYADAEFGPIASGLCDLLDLKATDVLLDLCCGNGYLTARLAPHCRQIVGVDFSSVLLDVAKKYHQPPNVIYQVGDVLALDLAATPAAEAVTKVLMNAALQHFRPRHFRTLLEGIRHCCPAAAIIVIACVPDSARKWAFYDTVPRRIRYLVQLVNGSSPMGSWWRRGFIEATCRELGLTCTLSTSVDRPVARYRFDIRIRTPQRAGAGTGQA